MESHIKKSRFSVKSRFKESKCDDRGHSLIWDFTWLAANLVADNRLNLVNAVVK